MLAESITLSSSNNSLALPLLWSDIYLRCQRLHVMFTLSPPLLPTDVSSVRIMATGKEHELQKVSDSFGALRRRAKELGIKDSQLTKLTSVRNLRKRRSTCLVFTSFVFGLVGILTGFGLILHQQGLLSNQPLWKVAEYVLDFDIEKDICVIPYPEIILDMFRPPVECAICEDVHQVDRVSLLSREEFVRKYAYTSRPVVITDGTKDWTASQHFSFDYFKSIYGPESPVLLSEDQKCQFFPYKTNFKSLQEVFNMSKEDANMKGNPWYIGW